MIFFDIFPDLWRSIIFEDAEMHKYQRKSALYEYADKHQFGRHIYYGIAFRNCMSQFDFRVSLTLDTDFPRFMDLDRIVTPDPAFSRRLSADHPECPVVAIMYVIHKSHIDGVLNAITLRYDLHERVVYNAVHELIMVRSNLLDRIDQAVSDGISGFVNSTDKP